MIEKEIFFIKHRIRALKRSVFFNFPVIACVFRNMYPYRMFLFAGLAFIFAFPVGHYFYIEAKKENHIFNIWYHLHGGSFWPDLWRPPEYFIRELDAIQALGGDENGENSMFSSLILISYAEHGPYYNVNISPTIPLDWYADSELAQSLFPKHYRQALEKAPDNPHFRAVARYTQSSEWVNLYIDTLERFPKHPYNAMMAYYLAYDSYLPDNEKQYYRGLYEDMTGRYLKKSRKDRPGYRPIPELKSTTAFSRGKEGLKIRLAPDETVVLEELNFYNSDRGKVGLYVRVTDGDVSGRLMADGREFGAAQRFQQNEGNYRFFPCDNPDGVKKVWIVLQAGKHGAEIVLRDYYPMIGNPRFYRTPSEYFFVRPLKRMVARVFQPLLQQEATE